MPDLSDEEEEKLAQKWRKATIKGQGNLFEDNAPVAQSEERRSCKAEAPGS
jgi:hypothetical protein